MSKVVFVTGAASGIGHVLVEELLKRGHRVAAADVNLQGMKSHNQLAAAGQLLTLKLDVRKPDQWQQVIEQTVAELGGLDVLCNVAGVLKDNWVRDVQLEEIDFQLDVNVKGVMLGMQAALAHMLPLKRGQIINIASLAALSPVPGLSVYSASKFAVRSYSISAAMELAEHGIAVTAICPDAVQTPMLDIQMGKETTALTFSGPRALTALEVAQATLQAMDSRAVEVMLPAWRGATAKMANLFPGTGAKLIGLFRRAGQKRQREIQAGKASTHK